MAVASLKNDSSPISSEYLLKLKKVFNLILNDIPDNRDDTIILKLIDSLKTNLNLSRSQLNDQENDQSECESIEKRFLLVLFLHDYLLKEILTNDDASVVNFSNSKLNEDKDAEVLAFFFDLLNVFVKSSRLLLNDVEKYLNKDSNKKFAEQTLSLNKISSSFFDKLLEFLQSFLEAKFDPTNLQIESSVCCAVLSLVEEMYEYFSSRQISKFFLLLDTHLFSIETLHLFLNIDYKSLFVRRAFKRVLQKHFVYLIDQAAAQNEDTIKRLDQLCLRIFQMDMGIKIHNLDFYARIFHFYFFENKQTTSSSPNSFMLLWQLKKLHSHLDFKNVKTNFLIDHNFALDENAIESFAQILAYDIIFSLINFDKETPTLLTNDILSFYKNFSKYLNSISIHYSMIQSNQIDNKLKRNTDLLFKFQIYFYSIISEWQVEFNDTNTQILNTTLSLFSTIGKDDSCVSIKEQINLLKYKIIRYMLLPLKINLKMNDDQSSDSNQIVELIGDIGQEFDNISSNIMHIKDKYDSHFDSLLDEENYLILINNKSFEYKQLLIKQSLINFKIFMRKFSLFSNKLNIFNLVNIEQIIYILRPLQFDFQVKRLLLQVLDDYFSAIDVYNIHLSHLLQEIMTSLNLKVNESFDESLFKLVGLCLKNLSICQPLQQQHTQITKSIEKNLIELINSHLEKTSQNVIQFREQLEILLNFFRTNLIGTEINNVTFNFIMSALDENDNYLVKKSNELLFFIDKDETESNQDLKESILLFYEAIFDCLQRRFEHSLTDKLANGNKYQTEVLSYKFENIINESFLLLIEEMALAETEAFTRRSIVNFLKSYRCYHFSKSILYSIDNKLKEGQLSDLRNSCKYFCYFLNNEFDWQVQMYCLEYLKKLFSLSFLLFEADQLQTEIILCLSKCIKSLIKSIEDFDQHVVHAAVSLLIQLKQNSSFVEQFNNLDENLFINDNRPSRLTTLKASLNDKKIKVSVWSDESNVEGEESQIKEFLSISIDLLKNKLKESKQTSDIYIRNPVMILDDIISSYQFDLDEEKAVDCY